MSLFTTTHNTFEGKLPDEEVLLLTRKHWIAVAIPLGAAALLSLLPFIAYSYLTEILRFPVTPALYRFLVALFYLILWHAVFYAIMLYALNTVIITNKRIIEHEQRGFFNHNVHALELYRVQDISVHTVGLLAALLRFGTLEVQSAGTQNKFVFPTIPDPLRVKNILMEAKRNN